MATHFDSPAKPCLKRSHYGTVTVYRPVLHRVSQALAELNENNQCRGVSTALDQWAERILSRRDRRLLRKASRNSQGQLNHKVTAAQ